MKGVDSMAMPEGSTLYELIQTGITYTHATVGVLVRLRKELSLVKDIPVLIAIDQSKIHEARSKKDTLRARAQSAKFVLTSISGLMLLVVLKFSSLVKWFRKTDASLVFSYFRTATKVSEMLGNVNTSSALSAFEKMEEKVLATESQAEALNQLTSDDLEGKSSSVDDDLASLKKEASGSLKAAVNEAHCAEKNRLEQICLKRRDYFGLS
ncbi:hypothetical protein Syun_022950 [Stephania yunnanensis]|uniref:Uncharacterized protein n=1 Tax=Stephania yunnanensis TaxID=152371 RepID=A0AAP0F8N9_9MAGN